MGTKCYLMIFLAFWVPEARDLFTHPREFHMIVTRMLGQM